MPYQLVNEHLSTDTIEALEQLLDSAKRGQIIGIAFALMLKRQRYMVDVTGEALRNPVLARGYVCVLDDQLARMIHRHLDSQTTM